MTIWTALVKPVLQQGVFVVVGGTVCVVSTWYCVGLLPPELLQKLEKQVKTNQRQAVHWLGDSDVRSTRPQQHDAAFAAHDDPWTTDDITMSLAMGATFSFLGCALYAKAVQHRVAREFQHRRDILLQEVQVHLQNVEQQHQVEIRNVRAQVASFNGQIRFPPPLDVVSHDAEEEAPQWATCPISFDLMTEPVITPSGVTYDRKSLLRWIDLHNQDPNTRQPITVQHVYPNLALRDQIESWIGARSNTTAPAAATEAPARGAASLGSLSVAELKRMITAAGLSYNDCTEKCELVSRAYEALSQDASQVHR